MVLVAALADSGLAGIHWCICWSVHRVRGHYRELWTARQMSPACFVSLFIGCTCMKSSLSTTTLDVVVAGGWETLFR